MAQDFWSDNLYFNFVANDWLQNFRFFNKIGKTKQPNRNTFHFTLIAFKAKIMLFGRPSST